MGTTTLSPIRFTKGEEEEVLLERPEREFEVESVIGGDEFNCCGPQDGWHARDSHKGLWEGSQMKCEVMDWIYFAIPTTFN